MTFDVGAVREPAVLRSRPCFNSRKGGVTPPLLLYLEFFPAQCPIVRFVLYS